MSQNFNKLVTLLKELFQLDQPELDFGLYRIMHAKSGEITQFLEKDLLPQVQDAFREHQESDKAALEVELGKMIQSLKAAGADPDNATGVKELRKKISYSSNHLETLENEVYDHLYSFFRRYYHEGDFISKRVYKKGVYAIPYEGEEVKLHWANKDQYYIKTDEYLKDYAFRLRPENESQPMRVHFKLVDAKEGEHGNVKATSDKDRCFILAPASESGHDFLKEENGELSIAFEYRPATMADWVEEHKENATAAAKKKPPVKKVLLKQAVEAILKVNDANFTEWINALTQRHLKSDGSKADYSRLEAHLQRYSARNTFDYFIHKDLGGFLTRELDFYIKNEVMQLDDIEHETAPRVEQYLSKIKVIRKIAGKIITFLAQLENFQKKLWLKKKFVVETNYCITLDRIPEEFYPEIAANEAQREEWVKLFAIDEIEASTVSPAYSVPLTIEFLKANTNLLLDTKFYNHAFHETFLNNIGSIEYSCDGLLVHSENFQASGFLRRRYKNQSKLVYLDPPYNTDATPILYKNNYKESSWATLMSDRISCADAFARSDGVVAYAIDDTEVSLLKEVIKQTSANKEVFQCIVEHYPGSGTGRSNVSRTHEYCLYSVLNDFDVLRGDAVKDGERVRGFRRAGTGDNNFRIGKPGRPESFFAVLVNQETFEVAGAEEPPIIGEEYPTSDTPEGYKRVYPIGKDGSERVWTLSYLGALEAIADNLIISSDKFVIKRVYHDKERRELLPSIWQGKQYNATTGGTNLLTDIYGEAGRFDYPKSIGTLHRVLDSVLFSEKSSLVIDLFGGSGTTAHALIERNRYKGSRHKYVLTEMGEYADSVIKERICKAAYTTKWNSGRPTSRDTGISHCFKYIRLESYEDTLNNLEIEEGNPQQGLFAKAASKDADCVQEEYLLRYMLDVETRESPSLLNIQAFKDPTAYKLKVKRPGSDESKEVKVDLLETFNYLIGLTVEHIAAPQVFSPAFKNDKEKRLQLRGPLKAKTKGPYWFRTVKGTQPDGQKTLIIWRKLTECPEKDNLVLNEWFKKAGYLEAENAFDCIYVNGDCNLENLKGVSDTWSVHLLEAHFHRLMFETEDA